MPSNSQKPPAGLRRWLYEIIFESHTPAGQAFDVVLIVLIVTSVGTVMAESVPSIRAQYGPALHALEWGFTILFTIEFVLRLYCVVHPGRYAFSFFGLIDLLAILPTYISLVIPGAQALIVIRVLRVLRVFRILKLTHYSQESRALANAMWASRRRIGVFFLAVTTLLVIVGSLMYLIEGPENGFTDIPTSIYWAVVTLTTVGYGDISPKTPAGRVAASIVMIIGYSIIAVPTGIVTAELTRQAGPYRPVGRTCPSCQSTGHESDARHCKYCGSALGDLPT